ncbi:hypothetical protein [Flavilitoribacter nigricans]|uniref:DUF4013 domain-containing protein n=1 Tax=Flavilitoribacter nigricans (strain ATCC 23147 / DSM 23189 / NBRC 102662 / NCIMB 1420 / SS-2) TaxID=1122177 RepID=A0A2D0MWP8_FLAN2|nr:hypothetical protein [Flavilitoribacter nigricans]PHN00701.1 hypothetical protein CRP01_40830 [Flavilitoribacter nigricans DSM 23189 = NBRC 102662]
MSKNKSTAPKEPVKWVLRLWQWIVLVILSIIPFVNFIFLRGWRIKVVEKVVRAPQLFDAKSSKQKKVAMELFSPIVNAPMFFLKGAILWLVHWLFWSPIIIFFLLMGYEMLISFVEILIWGGKSLFGLTQTTFTEIMADNKQNLLTIVLGTTVYYFIYWPIYRAGMIRYAVEGKVRYLFQILQNLKFAQKYARFFIPACFYATAVDLILLNLAVLIGASIPVIGYGIVVVIIFPAVYATTAYVYGNLAKKIYGAA